MASPKELAPLLPETLPEDFNDWDSKASAAPLPVHSGEREAWEAADAFSEAAKPLWQSADREALLASLVDGPRDSGSASSTSVFVKQQEDFIDWDSEATPAPWPVDRTEWEEWEAAHSFGKTAKSPGQSADREAFLSPVVDRPRDLGSAASAPVIVKQQELTDELVNGSPSRASHKPEAHHTTNEVPVAPGLPNVATVDGTRNSPEPTATVRRKADEALIQLFSPKNIEVKGEQKTAKKKWITIAGVSAGAILLPLVLMIPLLHHGTKSVAKHSVQPLPGATDTQPNTNTPNPSASKPPAQGKPLATTEKQQTTDNQPTDEQEGTTPTQAQSTTMNDQLTAPTRIPKQEAENAPPPGSIDTAGADGLGGGNANASIFNGHAQPSIKVTASKPVAISSGVATGMLIQSTPPVYPSIAKTSRVAGTVELHAIISTNGTIKDLQAVSGPVMLRQAAVDAVRKWRYEPYRLNKQPVEVETTINVVFTLGG
jgi:TonB family protein